MTRTFKEIRLEVKEYWLAETKRKRYINDSIIDSFECLWQNNYTEGDKHNSIFCSIGEWNNHITDILTDRKFDKVIFASSKHNTALFRYYTRLFLVVSEILTDFLDLMVYLNDIKNDKARKLLNIKDHYFTFQEFFDYINNICKHKIGDGRNLAIKYHCLNHHIDYFFLDSGKKKTKKLISIKNLSSIKVDGTEQIEVPRIIDVIKLVINCYNHIDLAFRDNYPSYKTKLSKFEK
ncbi:hypothetical protein MYP_3301 [Sporocytophaga myxococcoides]|uniref:Uncharacterized protein n=2 Tax=Sporocytophaga myxococcoides TaxID=153721 RepID=A0A098LI08_9BACT|nr:hypothetical protein MYP_3301 [Sporocytophaga myxococcoides]